MADETTVIQLKDLRYEIQPSIEEIEVLDRKIQGFIRGRISRDEILKELKECRSYNDRTKRIMEMGLHLENKLTKNITGHPQEKDQIHEGKQSKQDNQENTSIQEDYVGHRESAFRKVQGEQGRFSSSKNANEVFETLHGDVSGQVNGGSEFHIPISIGMEPSLV